MSFFSQKQPAQTTSFGSSAQSTQPFSNGVTGSSNNSTNSAHSAANGTASTAATSSFTSSASGVGFAKTSPGNAASLPAQITPDASSNRILKDLLDSAHNLPKLKHGNIAPINLTLSELRKETQELRKHEKFNGNHTKAHYLLSGSGVNAADFEHDLNALPSVQTSESGVEIPSRNSVRGRSSGAEGEDIENYLIAKKDETILSAIEQSLASASRDFDKFINSSISIDWKVRKDNLKKQLGIPVRTKISNEDLAKSFSWNKSLPGTSRILTPLVASKKPSGSTKQVSRDKFESNASCCDLCKSNADSKSKQMGEIWRILADLCNEKFAKVNQEQLFYDAYQKPATQKSIKKTIVNNSKTTLEVQFFSYMDEIYTKDDKKPLEFQPATNINKVAYFIDKVITKNNDSKLMAKTLNYNGVPIWALVFYLMRSGLYTEAVDLTKANAEAFNKFDKNFPVYLSHFVKSGGFSLPSELQERISSDYNQTFQFIDEDAASFDPYKYAVYKIIGKCDLVKKNLPSALNLSIEDWLWFHLSILNEFGSAATSDLLYENYTLENLQKKVVSSGPARFNASSNHPVYAKTLVMLGLYELAVQYVYENINECDAVHLAISLSYYGLLRSAKTNTDDLIAIDSNGGFQINFSRLLGSYTRTFKISDPKVAAQYLILICISDGGHNAEETSKCHEALRELISISREFGLLLGDLTPDTGDKTPGILERQRALINLPDIKTFDALRLYQLCQEYDTVVSLLNKFLSEILSMTELDKSLLSGSTYRTPDGEIQATETSENNLILLSRKLKEVFERNSFITEKISPKEREINDYLLPIVDIRESFVKKDWRGALDGVKALGLVPIVDNDDFIEIRRAADSLNGYDVKLVKVIPSVLTIVMTSISQINYIAMTKKFGIGGQERVELDKLKTVAKNCMVYAGMIQYRMPRETYSLLVNLESSL
ncbi:hypothetical protein JCM33374_g2216 [Metschnikowia sp. JCM 33374]|nr:hypothetical protein JCM33374_g2216 [Metschnikowia sp. JCM 33374]